MLTVDEISLPSEESCEDGNSSPSIQRIDMDLMEDLHEIIYRRCSVSSDNLNSFGIEECLQDESCTVSGAVLALDFISSNMSNCCLYYDIYA